MKSLLTACSLCLVLLAHAAPASATDTDTVPMARVLHEELNRELQSAQKAYAREDHAEALEHFAQAARWGNKRAQYMVGYMLLQGMGAEENAIEAYAWLHVAIEARDPLWIRLHRELEQVLPETALKTARELGNRFRARYGVDIMEIDCRRVAPTGSNVRESHCRRVGVVMGEDTNFFMVPQYDSTIYSNTRG